MSTAYYPGTNGFIFVYDVTNRKSLDTVKSRMHRVEEKCGKGNNWILVGNKNDNPKSKVNS